MSPPNDSSTATIVMGTAQFTSTNSPKETFPRMAAILPIAWKMPDAVDLKNQNRGK